MNNPKIWQNSDGTWSHHKDGKRKWYDRDACVIDLRFTEEWEKSDERRYRHNENVYAHG